MYNVCLLKGDGIGPEIVDCSLKILGKVCEKYSIGIEYTEALIGGAAIDAEGDPLPKETVQRCKAADAVFLGAVGGPKWDRLTGDVRPEAGLLGIRKELNLFANLRPAICYSVLKDASPLKAQVLGEKFDILVIRELTGGIYFGKRGRLLENTDDESAFDTEQYSRKEIRRIAHVGFKAALGRGKKLTSIDKANVLESSRLWRDEVLKVSKEYPGVELNHMYVDNAAMQLIRDPKQFDVIVTSNMFGDILSDEASMITGSLGMLPSASLSDGRQGLYEPIHGSAPDIAGLNIANPMATILSAAMMLRYSFEEHEAAKAIENAVESVLNKGYRTKDLARDSKEFCTTDRITDLILNEID